MTKSVTSQALYIQNCSGMETEKKWVFSRDAKTWRKGAEMTCCGRLLQTRADREGSIADGGESSSADNQCWRRCRAHAVAVEPRDQLVGRVRRWGTAVPIHAGICIRGRRVWSQSVLEPSANGVDEEPEWRGRISTTEKSAGQLHSSPIGTAEKDVLGWQPGSSCKSPVETKQALQHSPSFMQSQASHIKFTYSSSELTKTHHFEINKKITPPSTFFGAARLRRREPYQSSTPLHRLYRWLIRSFYVNSSRYGRMYTKFTIA